MSTITSTLRDIGMNRGLQVCEEAADEIEALEKAYELLFAEYAKLRAAPPSLSEQWVEAAWREAGCTGLGAYSTFLQAQEFSKLVVAYMANVKL